jgi:hypothetical protein
MVAGELRIDDEVVLRRDRSNGGNAVDQIDISILPKALTFLVPEDGVANWVLG